MITTLLLLAAFANSPARSQDALSASVTRGIELYGGGSSHDPAWFHSAHSALIPKKENERWTEIPWESDLAAARKKAAAENKPLLMWVMDGHPLGCT